MHNSEALQFHHKLSLYIENAYKDNLSPHYESLSYHTAFSPERVSTAFKYDCLAADQQISIGGYGKALYLIKIAMGHAKNVAEMTMLKDIVECAAEDMFLLSDGMLTKTDETPGRRFMSRVSAIFSPAAIRSMLGGTSTPPPQSSKSPPIREEGHEEDVGNDELIEAPSISGEIKISTGWKKAYRRLLKIEKVLKARIDALKEFQTASGGVDKSIIMPATMLGWSPQYLEARTAEKEMLKANESSSIFSKYFSW